MGRIPDHVIDDIARATDVVRLVGQYVELKRKGNRFWGLCPFHQEDTPSFTVNPERSSYKCFGCNEGGSVFSFLMKMESLEFPEVVRILAERAGIDISAYGGRDPEARDRNIMLRKAHEFATEYYVRLLKSPAGQSARQYLLERHLTEETLEAWRLGYAPDGWHNLEEAAGDAGFPGDVLVEAGLLGQKQETGNVYDRFRNRVMFPIADRRGGIIAFGARALDPEEDAKYLNSPESSLFSKGRNLYGLAEAKEAVRSQGEAVIVEGYMDVIMAHQHGVEWVVGVLGTALTEYHARELKRLCDTVVLVFDADAAGQKAASASLQVLLKEDLNIRVATLPSGLDPCDFLVEQGREPFVQRLNEAEEFFSFKLAAAREQHGDATVDGRQRVFEDLLPLALAPKNPVKRELLVRWIARELGINEATIWNHIQKANRTAGPGTRRPENKPERAGREKLPVWRKMLMQVFGMLLAEPGLSDVAGLEAFMDKLPRCSEQELLAEWLQLVAESGEDAEASVFINRLESPESTTLVVELLEREEQMAERIELTRLERLQRCLRQFNMRCERSERQGLKKRLLQNGDIEAERELLRRLQRRE